MYLCKLMNHQPITKYPFWPFYGNGENLYFGNGIEIVIVINQRDRLFRQNHTYTFGKLLLRLHNNSEEPQRGGWNLQFIFRKNH